MSALDILPKRLIDEFCRLKDINYYTAEYSNSRRALLKEIQAGLMSSPAEHEIFWRNFRRAALKELVK